MSVVFRLMGLLFLLYVSTSFPWEEQEWCVAKSDASEQALQAALDYACGEGADCAPIQKSGACFLPNTVKDHASYAFNSYYQLHDLDPSTCSFGGIATVVKTNPSHGACQYPSN